MSDLWTVGIHERDPRLLDQKETVPERLQLAQGVPGLTLGQVQVSGPRRAQEHTTISG
ncbi:hypothetical protein [Roseomonas indoligenes]|uniref:Uncharacterized protein n=1 Tax=Roseomonas indoligenes TaxID=2820811 RepID=A0A940S914_9PROT|nr:hypothetical protein [Pararoseomonas indoligenes]MBP0496480.1 hypothetical protein [Pararoseomonas indoligenes]